MTLTSIGTRRQFRTVTASQLCPICRRPDWCRVSTDGDIALCRRINDGTAKVRQYKDGGEYYCYRLHGAATPGALPEATVVPEPEAKRADPDTLHRVYSAMLDKLPLEQHHVQELRGRGLQGNLRATGYRSWPLQGRAQLARQLIDLGLEQHFPFVPGFRLKEGTNGRTYWTLFGSPGLVIPIRDAAGQIRALLLRPDAQVPGKKYVYLSGRRKDYNGPGPGSPIHVPFCHGSKDIIRITEGALKADVTTKLSGTLTIGLPGIGAIHRAVKVVRYLGAQTVRLAFDADARQKFNVASVLKRLAEELRDDGFVVELEIWDLADGKGIDDLLHNDQMPQVLTGDDAFGEIENILQAARSCQPEKTVSGPTGDGPREPAADSRQPPSADKPSILIDTDERRVNDAAITALANEPALYHRAHTLVSVLRDAGDGQQRLCRPTDSPLIAPLPLPRLREMMADAAHWKKVARSKAGKRRLVAAHPPAWSVNAVAARGSWTNLRPLEAVTETPVIRPDGSLLDQPGYDPATGLLYEPSTTFPPIPQEPSRHEAQQAARQLLELVCDFPFANDAHKVAWLAALLTVLARFTFAGPAPLFLFDANCRGSGKSLLASLIALIGTGRDAPRTAYPPSDEEMHKIITAVALAGDRLILLDNIDAGATLGYASLDAALTATTWKGRILGLSKMTPSLPLHAVWLASGNNVVIGSDAHRRILPCRLESAEENPEERTAFRYPHLLEHVAAGRAAYVVAALTILRGYFAAGKPSLSLPAWGSYEGWSACIRAAVCWATDHDPATTRQGIHAQDDTVALIASVLKGWSELPGGDSNSGLTVAEMLRFLKDPNHLDDFQTLRDVFRELSPRDDKLSAGVIGNKLKAIRGRVVDGRALIGKQDGHTKTMRWRVVSAANLHYDSGDAGAAEAGGGEFTPF